MALRHCSCGSIAALLIFVSTTLGAPRLFLDSRPTNLDPADSICRIIFREMPRQALIVSATEDFGVVCIDPTVEPGVTARDGDVSIGLDRKVDSARTIISLTLFDDRNQSLGKFDIRQKVDANRLVFLDEFAERCDEIVRTTWQPILAKQLGAEPVVARWDLSLPAPDEVERLLGTVDFMHAFLAARLTHQAIRESGASPARLGALVRAYAHLGDSTRHLCAAQSIGFFARSLMYAQRLVRLAEADPSSWRHRAYAEALAGMNIAAEAHMTHAEELQKQKQWPAAPSWVALTRQLLAFDTIALYGKVNDPKDGALASYFTWLTVEHSLLRSLPIRFGALAMQSNPGAVRVLDSMGANAGVGMNHQITQQSTLILNRLLASLSADNAAPQAVRDAATEAIGQQFSIPAILKFLAVLDAQPTEDRQPLQWSTLSSLARECQFTNAVQRLNFVTHSWNVDPTTERAGWLTLLKGHRYQAFLESYVPSSRPPDPQILERVRAIDFKDDSMSANAFVRHLQDLGITTDPRRKTSWSLRQRQQSGNSAYDVAQSIWRYRFGDFAEASLRDFMRSEATILNTVRPDHPLAITILLTANWEQMKDRAQALQRDAESNPILAYGLGRAYVAAGQIEAGRKLLEIAAIYAPDRAVYEQLADTYLTSKDMRGWLDTWDTYLRNSDDYGLDHAKVSEEIAYRLCTIGDLDNALKYAERSNVSGSAWGMEVYAHVLTRKGQYEAAAVVVQNNVRRYNNPGRYYRFAQMTGRGDLAAARRALEPVMLTAERSTNADQLLNAALFQAMEGNNEKALQLMQKTFAASRIPYNAALLALLHAEQKQIDQAVAVLRQATSLAGVTERDQGYQACIAEMLRCLTDPAAIPARDGKITAMLALDGPLGAVRGNSCYFIGRVAELNKHDKDAIWWYRAALDSESGDFNCRALAAMGLRRLGDNYYP